MHRLNTPKTIELSLRRPFAAEELAATNRRQTALRRTTEAILVAGLAVLSTASAVTLAHAQEPDSNKYVYLYASAGGYTKKVTDFNGETRAADTTGDGLPGTNTIAAANFGVLHAQATATSDPASSLYANEAATSGAAFGDLLWISDPDLSPTTMIPMTVTFILDGNIALIPDLASDTSFENFEKGDVDMTAFWNSVGGPIIMKTTTKRPCS